MEAADGGALPTKDVCNVGCNDGSRLRSDDLKRRLTECPRETLYITNCQVDSEALAPLRSQAHPDLTVMFQSVSGTVDLRGAELHQAVVVESKGVEFVNLHDATVDRVRIAPSTSPVADAYQPAAAPPRTAINAVNARGCHAKRFLLLASDVSGTVDLGYARVDEILNLTWTKATAINARFADALRVEAAQLQTEQALDLFGVRASQVMLNGAQLGDLNLETATIDRVLSLRNATVIHRFDGSWLSAGALVVDNTKLGTLELGYGHLGLLDIGSQLDVVPGPTVVDGLHVDAVSGDVRELTRRLTSHVNTEGAFHSIETALRSAGRNDDANTVAFAGAKRTAAVGGKLPLIGAAVVLTLLCWFVVVAYLCCRRASQSLSGFRLFLCALDIVLPSFVDIGALSAWTNYDDPSKVNPEVDLRGAAHDVAFAMRILGTMAFTYLLLYVTNLRG